MFDSHHRPRPNLPPLHMYKSKSTSTPYCRFVIIQLFFLVMFLAVLSLSTDIFHTNDRDPLQNTHRYIAERVRQTATAGVHVPRMLFRVHRHNGTTRSTSPRRVIVLTRFAHSSINEVAKQLQNVLTMCRSPVMEIVATVASQREARVLYDTFQSTPHMSEQWRELVVVSVTKTGVATILPTAFNEQLQVALLQALMDTFKDGVMETLVLGPTCLFQKEFTLENLNKHHPGLIFVDLAPLQDQEHEKRELQSMHVAASVRQQAVMVGAHKGNDEWLHCSAQFAQN